MNTSRDHQTIDSTVPGRARLTAAEVEALMAIPLRPPPTIIVLGDDAVSAIRLPAERPN